MRTLTTLFVAGLGLSLSLGSSWVQAEKIYRWTDAKGQVHFSSQQPRDNSAEKLNIKGQPQLGSDAPVEGAAATAPSASDGQPAKAENKTAVPASIDAKQAQENCRIATEHKKSLSENYSRRYQQADGSFRPLSDSERSEQNTKMDEMIKKFCTQ
ncbi:MAG: hypothetical protein RL217_2160 [Pseudomonadota bacterium]|jgi:hypothetical protein